jgi:hypothetical protein
MADSFMNSTRRSIAQIKSFWDREALELAPPFQRNPVWTSKQKAYLLDTILRGFPIPELYMKEVVEPDGSESFVVVDGQQRIRACLEFLEDEFELSESEGAKWADLSFSELPMEYKQKIYAYNFMVRQLPDLPETVLREVFQRINKSTVSLNKQELRHATYWGGFISSMEKISDFQEWEQINIFTANDIRRMLDVEFISELAIAYLHGPQNKKGTLDGYYKHYEESFERRGEVENTFRITLAELIAVIPNFRQTRWGKKSDFYTLFQVFSKFHHLYPLTSNVRRKVLRTLMQFSDRVDRQISGDRVGLLSVRRYARAVERAASDLSNRKIRADALQLRLRVGVGGGFKY